MGIRVGILGGMFDPLHIGHCILAEQCIEQLRLHTCYLIPAYQSPLRTDSAYATPYQRWMMARIVARTNPRFRALDIEIRRKQLSFTIDTIERLQAQRPKDVYHLVIGADQLIQFRRWHRWEEIIERVTLVVAPRQGIVIDSMQHELEQQGARIVRLEMPLVAVSSTLIRDYRRQGRSIRYLVHDKVYRYILRHKLYQRRDAS
ncbi:MAG: nicotinate (nicotinamide) nucleotide adenylyltransferase [Bacteroidota bacterium]|nr:nicotinate (nicotinamide) nucleotide adenylyltransferase [Candidatus Kapabacteria bacterium]MCS7302040.1 nicotinate (nicotinamide) nucleotide adenylyltransferase [Candidatus Kapabacteria bacterium]MCX7936840.1 nicotinate (nicotinamide) nucleotide adenylyltransferase [Chlorobiota bacterium]MDW8074559.1 nicotinate (nicotinamide) nucleotide adenylyltransferase [Bacteroidota bacterium]MDW8270965.1 nicotinate (nicotinamide) nucleotide adenylyltransferase [Bacteroidota bacterium]